MANSKIGQSFDWSTDSDRAGCFIPDESVSNRANGAWGYPTVDALQLEPYRLNPVYFVYVYANRGVRAIGNANDPVVQIGSPIAWTVQAPDGRRWATNWQAFP